MMNSGPEWFRQTPGTYSAVPITWQGWAVTILFTVAALATGKWLNHKPAAMFAILIPLTALMIFITLKTTKGGWRWRWGDKK
jgi:hypothetical protein